MARIPDTEIERLKQETDLADLVRSYGIELGKHGQNLKGLCPFHSEKTPSLIVTPRNNLWKCQGACDEGGTVIDFVMRIESVNFLKAVEILQGKPASRQARPPKPKVMPNENDPELLGRVITYYQRTLKNNTEAQQYLEERGLTHPEMLDTFQIGFADGTLHQKLPNRRTGPGKETRQRLQQLGIYREDTGHEHFRGCLVIPITDEHGNVSEIYGRRSRYKANAPEHMYLPGPHKGIFNIHALQATDEIILCESIIDALTFWCAGYRNVTASYGTGGFTSDHLAAFKQHQVKRVLIAYDRDNTGQKAAAKLQEKLEAEGIDVAQLHFPKSMDANEYALKTTPAKKSLGVLIDSARAKFADVPQVEVTPVADAPVAEAVAGDEITVTFGDRHYRVRGLENNSSYDRLKINVLAKRGEGFYVDTLDLYGAKQRAGFIKQAAIELDVKNEVIKSDLGKLLGQLETIQDRFIQDTLTPDDPEILLTDDEHMDAMELLQDEHLIGRILADFDACGVVGEEINKLVGYLAATSRQLEKPLAIVVQSTSAAGKSSLMDAVLDLMPSEQLIKSSMMTGQSLYYMGQSDLKHKILAVAEEEGMLRTSYGLKLLQSEGELAIHTVIKDPDTGEHKTKTYKAEGPVMLFLTTTVIDIDEELMNRCLVLTVNETREQTQAIHALQRKKRTLEGLRSRHRRTRILQLHRNAQRLLKPLQVLNPFAERLTFVDTHTRTRRDHEKYLTLIDTLALLHQHQRETKRDIDPETGEMIEFIEVIVSDIELANRLAHDVLGRSLDELPPQTRRLLIQISEIVDAHCKENGTERPAFTFSRRELREQTGCSDTALKRHLARLVDLEYLILHKTDHGRYEYELLLGSEASDEKRLPGLIDFDSQTLGTNRSGSKNNRSTPGHRGVTPRSGGGPAAETVSNANGNGALGLLDLETTPKTHMGQVSLFDPNDTNLN